MLNYAEDFRRLQSVTVPSGLCSCRGGTFVKMTVNGVSRPYRNRNGNVILPTSIPHSVLPFLPRSVFPSVLLETVDAEINIFH